MTDGLTQIPIEERNGEEVARLQGLTQEGEITEISIKPAQTAVRNDAFDVTPRKYVTGLITERGICAADADALSDLFPELAMAAGQAVR